MGRSLLRFFDPAMNNAAGVSLLLGALWLAGCAAPSAQPASPAAEPSAPRGPKTVRAVVMAELPTLISKGDRSLPGADAIDAMVSAGFVITDDRGLLRPELADAIPDIENGLWKISPDGKMETTWKLKPIVAWQDGTTVSTEDLIFTLEVARDKRMTSFSRSGYDLIERIDAPDARTLIVHWSQPFIEADRILSTESGSRHTGPLPKHLLEQTYKENWDNFLNSPYWSEDYVGAGPYKLRQWVRGSYMVLEGFDRYVLGRPKIDEFEVRFVPDANAAVASVLSGQSEIVLGRGLSLDQATDATARWADGKMDFGYKSWIAVYPQFINPSPTVIANLQFRRALMHGLDRQQMVDTFLNGLTSVADSYLSPKEPEYQAFASRLVRYEYNPQKAAELIEQLGYRRGADGMLQDAAGQPLAVEIRTTAENTLHRPTVLSIADYWQRLGIRTEVVFIPAQRQTDLEYRSTRSGFELLQNRNDLTALGNSMHSKYTSLPENNYFGAGNLSRYTNPELDALINRYYGTIAHAERTDIVAQVNLFVAENLNQMGMYYSAEFSLVANRLLNARARQSGLSNQTWNVYEWDVR